MCGWCCFEMSQASEVEGAAISYWSPRRLHSQLDLLNCKSGSAGRVSRDQGTRLGLVGRGSPAWGFSQGGHGTTCGFSWAYLSARIAHYPLCTLPNYHVLQELSLSCHRIGLLYLQVSTVAQAGGCCLGGGGLHHCTEEASYTPSTKARRTMQTKGDITGRSR